MGRHDDIRYSGGGALSSARPLVRRRLAWALAVPLIATSLEVAHAASYQLVYPDGPGRARVLALSGHGYERHFPAVAALLASVLVGALLDVQLLFQFAVERHAVFVDLLAQLLRELMHER